MLAVIQRVTAGSVEVDQKIIGKIDEGIVALIAVEPDDQPQTAEKMIDKILAYRIFSDQDGKMNRSVRDIAGGLLLISQFTLAASTDKGLRPSFTTAAPPQLAEPLFEHLVAYAQQQHEQIQTGQFAADMTVNIVNDGPVTFILKG
jgi:D-tyrosyl-tRNA(Tyr) deacylase